MSDLKVIYSYQSFVVTGFMNIKLSYLLLIQTKHIQMTRILHVNVSYLSSTFEWKHSSILLHSRFSQLILILIM